ncbi:hypothetical protein OROHE_025657 [Orobanche hederae]
MSSQGGFTAAPPPRQNGDRFYNPPARRHQQILLQQQQMLQRQLLQQQQQQQQLQQRLLDRRTALTPEYPPKTEAETRNDAADSSTAVALSVPPSVSRGSTLNLTNLDRLMESVTPFIQARYLPEGGSMGILKPFERILEKKLDLERYSFAFKNPLAIVSKIVNPRGRRAREVDSLPFFYLEDLWEFFSEWSYYGAGVPLLLNGKDKIEQYYVPFLSGIQLFTDPSNPSSRLGGPTEGIEAESYMLTNGSNVQRLNKISLGDKSVVSSVSSKVAHSYGLPSFQFLEYEQPYNRRPLADKISLLASEFPELSKYKSCDLLPTSWICVAWYPIYRIPVGPTLQDLDASFLTFHSLSTQPRSDCPPRVHAPNTPTVRGVTNPTAKISLPVFALASYKLKGSIVSPSGPHECEQENSLQQAADKWLNGLEVMLPDYQFFLAHSSQRR